MKGLSVGRVLTTIVLGVVLATATYFVPRESRVTMCARVGASTPGRLLSTGWPVTWWAQTSCETSEIDDRALLLDIVFWSAMSAVVVFGVAYAVMLRRPR
jgi:hypothetical protein